jgi:hypothetical protein
MENKGKVTAINFALRNITTEQFAILEDVKINLQKIRLNSNLRFAANEKDKVIAVFSNFTFESEETPFLIIETGCHFNIKPEEWKQMLNEETNSLQVPKGFLSHLSMLTVGTARGVLHAKTENTKYNRYVLPTINVASMIKNDAVFNFGNENK